jgi:hypothetical protein
VGYVQRSLKLDCLKAEHPKYNALLVLCPCGRSWYARKHTSDAADGICRDVLGGINCNGTPIPLGSPPPYMEADEDD